MIAEGVETQSQHNAVCAVGCEEAQGYFYARAIAASQLGLHISGLVSASQQSLSSR